MKINIIYLILILFLLPLSIAQETTVQRPPECEGLSDQECEKLLIEKPAVSQPTQNNPPPEQQILPEQQPVAQPPPSIIESEKPQEGFNMSPEEDIEEEFTSETVNLNLETIGGERTKVEVEFVRNGKEEELEFELETTDKRVIIDEIVKRTSLERKLVENMVFAADYSQDIETIEAPEGCIIEEGKFGKFVICEKRDDFLEELKEKCENSGGKFGIGKFGPECIFEKEGTLFGEIQCPREEDLERMKNQCIENKGTPENFIDNVGCVNILCNFVYEEKYKDEEDKFYRECSAKGGQPVFIKGEPRCFNPDEKIKIKEEFEPLEPTELLKIALKIENTIKSLIEVGENFEQLKNFYIDRDSEKSAVFENALVKIDGATVRLEEIKSGLAQRAGGFTKEDRIQVLQDIQNIKNIIQEIAIDILTGKKGVSFEAKETDFMKAIRHCEDFSKDNPFKFNSDPNTVVELFGLDDKNRCVMVVDSEQFGGMNFLIPSKIYPFLKGQELLLSKEIECSPEDVCEKIKLTAKSEEEYERFGEGERFESTECTEAGVSGDDCFELIFEKGKLYECRDLSFEECKELMFKFKGGEFDE